MTAWIHLPNAAHIGQVLVDLNDYPVAFGRVRDATEGDAWNSAWYAAKSVLRGSSYVAAWNSAYDAMWDATYDVAGDVTYDAVRDSAGDAILALTAYEFSAEYLVMSPDQALVWGELRGDHAYVLLRPYLRVRVKIAQSEQGITL